jgi:uncharacterized repeat protein (TIGR01451 family)
MQEGRGQEEGQVRQGEAEEESPEGEASRERREGGAMTVKTPLLVLVLLLVGLVFAVSPAVADTAGPQWTISAVSTPTNIDPAAKPGEDTYTVLVTNTGGVASTGPVTVSDELPAGLALDSAGASGENPLAHYDGLPLHAGFSCVLAVCTYTPAVVPDQTLVVTFPLDVSASEPAMLTNVVRVSGGGAPAASQSTSTVVSARPAGFGFAPGALTTALSSLQAGAHPDITNTFAFDSATASGALAGDPKDVTYRLPPGFASDFADTPVCEAAQLALSECPIASQVGVTTVDALLLGGLKREVEPVYNLQPEPGQLAALAFSVGGEFFVEGEIALQPRSYGAEVAFANIDDALGEVVGGSLTVWGVPADPVHDPLRYANPNHNTSGGSFGFPSDANPTPYFTNPTSCGTEPLVSSFTADSWQQPGEEIAASMSYGPMVDCDRLTIEPKIEVQPSASSAETATGLNVNLEVPQHYQNPYGVVASNLDDVKVVLPEGMTINPSAGAGLEACSEAEFAYEGGVVEPEAGRGCPSESKLGSVHARSPGVPEDEEASGSLFLARPYENKFGSLIAIYLVVRIPKHGVVVTAAGRVELNAETGRLTTIFDEDPQLPVSDFVFTFHQGATSPLVTPPACGTFASEADLTPWSEPLQEHLFSSGFEVTSGVDGGACPSGGTPPFAPRLISGTQDNDAGAYSPFYLRIVREDGEQEITKFTTVLPPGLTGNLTGVPFCPEADIEAARAATGTQELEHPSCPQASEIGHTVVEAGVGTVLAQTPGKLYLAGPYHGAPLSVLSVTAAKVGPFDLGTVVIRFALNINPVTAQVEINGATSDPIPHIIDGIVVHVRDIRAYVDREKFIENPTSCDPLAVSDTIYGVNPANEAEVTPVDASSFFQAADCQNLQFKPTFKVSTSSKYSRTEGTSLTVKLAYPSAPQGTQANIRLVKVELPKQLPSRLSTLQKACTEAVFEANPASCPSTSIIGHAKAITPILPEPLEGPAYFVSHGGAKWPELIMVLQGYGFTIDLHGETLISKQGVTSSTFHAIPDEPVTSFELTLPKGKYSALTGLGNLCKGTLVMPTQFIAQNGMALYQNTKIAVSGCPKQAKRAAHRKKRIRHKKKGARKRR